MRQTMISTMLNKKSNKLILILFVSQVLKAPPPLPIIPDCLKIFTWDQLCEEIEEKEVTGGGLPSPSEIPTPS